MKYFIIFGPNLAPMPLTQSASFSELHPRAIRDDIAEIYLSPALVGVLRYWGTTWNNNFIADENRYVDDQVERVLHGMFEQLIPLVREQLPDWIQLKTAYPVGGEKKTVD
jgi:hypothetical protein